MTALEKLNALQAEIEAFAVDTRAGVYSNHPSDWKARHDKIQDTKVEVTKVVLPDALKDIEDYFKPIDMSGSPVGGGNWVGKIMDERKEKLDVALTLLQQLKESLTK